MSHPINAPQPPSKAPGLPIDAPQPPAEATTAPTEASFAPRDGDAPGAAPSLSSPTDGDVYGKAHALTVLTPIRPGWSRFIRLVLWGMRTLPKLSVALEQLSFIHYAHWAVIDRVPRQRRTPRSLHYDYLLFESNFDGNFEAYIEAFSEVLGERMQLIWGSSYGFPGTQPLQPLMDYIQQNALVADYYWSATPTDRTTTIVAALKLREQFAAFAQQARYMNPATFKAAYDEFITSVQLLI